jgi:phosphatidylglycerophosphatase A
LLNAAAKIISTFFYVGYLPLIPGTFGSLAGILVYYLIKGSVLPYVFVTLAIFILGFLSGGRAEKVFKVKDPRYIVIDEVSGMLLSLAFLPYDIRIVIIGFFIFRLMDTLKPYPAGSLQSLKGSKGIMVDDIIAGIYTNIILQLALRLAAFKTS